MNSAFEVWQMLTLEGTPSVLVTLVQIRGSAPQVVGAKMAVSARGLEAGTVGGGKIEAHCIRYAQEMLARAREPALETWNLQRDIGMSCGGEVSVFFEPARADAGRIALFGAGHVAQELCHVLAHGRFFVQVFDTRSEWVEKLPRSHRISARVSKSLASEVEGLPSGTTLLCMTQGHATDVPILNEALKRADRLRRIGVIGSDVKAIKIKAELKALGHSSDRVEQIVCPIGLAIGDSTPHEIAISITAQLIADRDGIRITTTERNQL